MAFGTLIGERAGKHLPAVLAESRRALVLVAILSAFLNILLLGGPLYLMLIYDSVMPSGSKASLFGLLIMIAGVYLFQGVFDVLRSRILGDVASLFDRRLSGQVHRFVTDVRTRVAGDGDGMTPVRDLDAIRSFLSGPGPGALLDLPWIIMFLALLTLLHFWLGVTAVLGALVLIMLTWMNDRMSRDATQRTARAYSGRGRVMQDSRRQGELVRALGMRERMQARWQRTNDEYLAEQYRLARLTGTFGASSKIFRMFLQSVVLSVGALLYLAGEASGGIVFAASILSSRALAPVDQAIANWRGFTAARQGWVRLEALLDRMSRFRDPETRLPQPEQSLVVEALAVAPPGAHGPILRGLNFKLQAGDALGIVGPSAAGKTSLIRTLVGIWPPLAGDVRIDGAALDNWDPDLLGAHIGYVPQTVELFEGTISENIARFDPAATSEGVIAAAKAAGVHEMVLRLDAGYDTVLTGEGNELSAGQRQRLGLARALYGDPFFVVLDEPNSNLDMDGETALQEAIKGLRARRAITVIVAHRPTALAHVSKVAVIKDGTLAEFGDRDDVFQKLGLAPAGATSNLPPGRVEVVRAK